MVVAEMTGPSMNESRLPLNFIEQFMDKIIESDVLVDRIKLEARPHRPSRRMNYTVRTLEEVASILGLSRQRVHEIERRALRKLRRSFARQTAISAVSIDR